MNANDININEVAIGKNMQSAMAGKKVFEASKRFISTYSCNCEHVKNFGTVSPGISISIFGLALIYEKSVKALINEILHLPIKKPIHSILEQPS